MKLFSRRNAVIASVAVGGIATALWRRRSRMDLQGKVVLITGGSRGLGIALARGFAMEGSRIALCARSEEELERASQDVGKLNAEVITIQCDVSDRAQAERAVKTTLDHFGQLDVLVNNAGKIQVGPIHTMTVDDFESAMDVMFWGTVYTTLAALPHMRQRSESRIVNITSIGARVSMPHLVPYSCAKFAAAAFSEGLRAELQSTGIRVVTILPGLMRTGSYLNAEFKGAEQGEARWFSVGASMPGLAMPADKAAKKIISATKTGSAERILGLPANVLARFHGLMPATTTEILSFVNRLLPNGSKVTERGSHSRVLRRPVTSVLTKLGREAAREYLQPSVD